ncbi:MAG: linear amide C-N hydrolase [Paramuribaculum sp.]|nr:linear amide C-N hydrolase [Paramuribaculum sp.]
MRISVVSALLAVLSLVVPKNGIACSRVLYVGNDDLRIVGRSLDWKTPIPTNLYVYPKGMFKLGNDIPGAVHWVSKYGAVYAVGYDGGVTEGMNEKGLVINGLFCKGTVYVNPETANRAPMSLAMFVAWLLDNNATTDEVVDVLSKQDFTISGATFDGGTVSALHWGVTDATGKSAVIEFHDGNINIYTGQDMPVLTNDPQYPAMQAINDYWKGVGGRNMLPGTVKSPDRFVRAYYFDENVEKTGDADLGFSIVRSILYNVSVPYHYTVDGEPNVSSTQWRSFANIRDLRYYFDIVTNYGAFYIDLKKCDFSKGASVMKLDTSKSTTLVGEINNYLVPSAPFTPMY